MSLQGWQEAIRTHRAAGTLFNNYTTAKSVLNNQGLWTMPENYLEEGRALLLKIRGALSNIVTTPGTVEFQVKVGSVIAFTTGQIQLSSTAHTTLPFALDIELTCRAIGPTTSANFMGQAEIRSQTVVATAVADGTQTHSVLMAPNTAPAVGTGFDSTVANIVDLWVGFSIANSGNGVQIQQYKLISEK